MVNKISESSENMKSAYFIEQHINEAKIKMLTNIFRTIDEYVTTLHSPISNEKFKSSFNKEIEKQIMKFYGKTANSANPVLRYEYKEIIGTTKKIIFEIHTDGCFFWGFVVENNKKLITQRNYLKLEDLNKYLPHLKKRYKDDDGRWIASGYLYDENSELCPDFFDIDPRSNSKNRYFELFNDKKPDDFYNEFIKKCKKDIKELLQE